MWSSCHVYIVEYLYFIVYFHPVDIVYTLWMLLFTPC